jgi:signal transduction histidine kinase
LVAENASGIDASRVPAAAGDFQPDIRVRNNDEMMASDVVLLDKEAFHEELRRRMPVLRWTLLIFNPVLLGWTAFDYLVVPEQWRFFLALRLAGGAVSLVAAGAVSLAPLKRYTWESLWIIAFVFCCCIAFMLPIVGEQLSRYVMGYIIVIIAAGLFPVWPIRWVLSVIMASLWVTGVIFFGQWDETAIEVGDVITNSFVIITLSAVSVVTAGFRYNLAKRDFFSRQQLSEVARRESEARLNLAKTSSDLQEALDRLQELERLRSKFFANISHELRTPLTLIIAPIEELTARIDGAHERQQLRVIRRNAERLLGLISDLLDLSRLDAGGLRLNLAEMDVRSVVATVYENSQPAALAKSIDFALVGEPSERKIWGDAHRLEMVITNLVSNAIKFTPFGGRIEVRVTDLEEGVSVEVEDTGPGIAPEDLPRVFERFFQVNPADRRREGGVGIGLALAKELVELHGGTIDVDSEPDRFTCFRIVIPFGRTHIRPEVIERRQQFEQVPEVGRRVEDRGLDVLASAAADLHGSLVEQAAPDQQLEFETVRFEGQRRARILLAEDHEEVRDFIKALLDPHFDVVPAGNGREAWQLTKSESPDLVVSDVMMPEMSGTELCRAIKSDPALRATPVILLTARVGSEATLEAYAYGADDFVAKPFHPRVLMARIRAQLKLRALGLQLAQGEKLAAVGTLAAGILHEVRNPVNAILNASRLLSTGSVDGETSRQLIDVISDGAQRIEGITSSLDSHARPADGGATFACDVREGIDSTIRLLGHRLDGVVVHREYRTDRLAQAPAGPLNQVFLNLLDNAVRAGAANIWIELDGDGDRVRITVSDDGPGISEHDIGRIFDPFYTNRGNDPGTGLGLYLSRSIVEEHGGALRCENRSDGGALFCVEIPSVGVVKPERMGEEGR